jgi:hypothetical protein
MLKNLLYLYNDGHNPFPRIQGGMVGAEEHKGSDDEDEEFILEIPFEYEDPRDTFGPKAHGPEFEAYKKEYEDYIDKMEEETGLELRNDYYDDVLEEKKTLDKINESTNFYKKQELDKLAGKTLDDLKGDLDKLIVKEKDLKKENIRNNLDKKKINEHMHAKAVDTKDAFFLKLNKKDEKTKKRLSEGLNEFLDDVYEMEAEDFDPKDVIEYAMKFVKLSNMKLDESLLLLAGYLYEYSIHPEIDKGGRELLSIVVNSMYKMIYKNESKQLDEIDKKIDENNKKVKDIEQQKKKLDMKIKYVEVTREDIKENQAIYSKSKEYYDKRREEREVKIDKIRKLTTSKPKEALKQIEKLEDEIDYDISKLKAKLPAKTTHQKTVSKTAEEKQSEIDDAVVNGRLETINEMSGDGKKLETYFTKQGQDVLHYITGDKSKVYDNELNGNIPDWKVELTNKEMASLRKAVTLDLYSKDTVYEIKNYNEYGINDQIPLQQTKLNGTGYFEHLYLPNGRLYNIKLHVTNPTTGELNENYVLPIRPDGYKLVVVYRLKDGVFYDEPMDLKHVSIKQSSIHKTEDGKPLFKYKKSSYTKMKDQYGNDSFDIQPYLKNIKDLKK